MLKQYIEDKAHRAVVCLTLGNICTGKPNSFCFILTDEALMNKLIVFAINADWKVKQYALTGPVRAYCNILKKCNLFKKKSNFTPISRFKPVKVLMNIILHCEKYQVLHLVKNFNLQSALCPCLRLNDLEYVRTAIRVINRLHTIIGTGRIIKKN